jgi:hypothetical protein
MLSENVQDKARKARHNSRHSLFALHTFAIKGLALAHTGAPGISPVAPDWYRKLRRSLKVPDCAKICAFFMVEFPGAPITPASRRFGGNAFTTMEFQMSGWIDRRQINITAFPQ